MNNDAPAQEGEPPTDKFKGLGINRQRRAGGRPAHTRQRFGSCLSIAAAVDRKCCLNLWTAAVAAPANLPISSCLFGSSEQSYFNFLPEPAPLFHSALYLISLLSVFSISCSLTYSAAAAAAVPSASAVAPLWDRSGKVPDAPGGNQLPTPPVQPLPALTADSVSLLPSRIFP